ncbi:hypothetical protein AB1L30_13830 [Bremerella sp. JC817]|uniref:hypothetical protein n=1 Tax=Bremerella sp. JC817 TaxID=3231756 RepID=UPI00345A3E84
MGIAKDRFVKSIEIDGVRVDVMKRSEVAKFSKGKSEGDTENTSDQSKETPESKASPPAT